MTFSGFIPIPIVRMPTGTCCGKATGSGRHCPPALAATASARRQLRCESCCTGGRKTRARGHLLCGLWDAGEMEEKSCCENEVRGVRLLPPVTICDLWTVEKKIFFVRFTDLEKLREQEGGG